jgi:chromate transporter
LIPGRRDQVSVRGEAYHPRRSALLATLEVLRAFLWLGLSAFGGPVAHLGYFREEFVVRRRWLDEHAFADLVTLCQFLPGPASSQVGFTIGLARAGWSGALAAWVGFTLPSAILLTGFAYAAGSLGGVLGSTLLHGLKLVAVAIVAQAVLAMARTSCADLVRAGIAVIALALSLLIGSTTAQVVVICLGALLGFLLCRSPGAAGAVTESPTRVTRRAGVVAFALYLALLAALPLLQPRLASPSVALFAAFYRCGALVFGGGHVVLPLLREAFVPAGWVNDGQFLAGYGAAQAIPGPLFTFAAYLGAVSGSPPRGIGGAALGLVGIFLPGILILLAALPFWEVLRRRAAARDAILGVNAAVVGLLAAALYNPVWVSAVHSSADVVLVLAGFALLTLGRVAPALVVLFMVLGALAFVL